MKMVKFLTEFEYLYCILEKNNFISKIKISKVTDYAALILVVPSAASCSISSLNSLPAIAPITNVIE